MSTFHYPLKKMIAGTLYRVDSVVGAGGMATVYQVTEMSCGRRYAFKHLNAELRDRQDLRLRFVAEGKLLGSLHGHENIVDVIMQGEIADELELPFIVMELLLGPNLRAVMVKRGAMDARLAGEIMAPVLYALEHAHEKGVIHRDVKPENIVLHHANGRPQPKLVDFGIYKMRHETSGGRIVGTPLYIAPELLSRDGEGDHARAHLIDIYSAGITLYELVTGRTPFEDEPTEEALLQAHRSKMPPPPSTLVAGMSAQLEDVIMRALEKDPRKRWPGAFAFAKAIRDGIQGRSAYERDVERINAHNRITAEQIPTNAETPIDERHPRTDPGAPPPGAERTLTPAATTPDIPETEPGVPHEVVQMMLAKAMAGIDGDQGTHPSTPDALKAAGGSSEAPTSAPAEPLDNAPRIVRAHPTDTRPGIGPSSQLSSSLPQHLSQVATRSRPPEPLAVGRTGTPVMALPPIHADPSAPATAWRSDVERARDAPVDELRDLWIDDNRTSPKQDDSIRLASRTIRSPVTAVPPPTTQRESEREMDRPPTFMEDLRLGLAKQKAAERGDTTARVTRRQKRILNALFFAPLILGALLVLAIAAGIALYFMRRPS